MVNGRTKAVERESSIIKAKTRTRDKGRGMRWKRGGGTNRIKTTAVKRGMLGEQERDRGRG